MRINVYNEELTDEVQVVRTEPRPGVIYVGVRFMLKSAPALHHRKEDDDRSAVTFWLGTQDRARHYFEAALEAISAPVDRGEGE